MQIVNEELATLRHKVDLLEKRDETNLMVIRSLRDENNALREQVRSLFRKN